MHNKVIRITAAALAAVAFTAGSVSAQSWQNIAGVNGAQTSFWDRVSADQTGNSPCNIGAVLTGVASNAGCSNEAPANLLPTSVNPVPNQYLGNGTSAAGFYFGAGTWDITLLGTITGSNPPRAWNIVDNFTNLSVGTITSTGTTLRLASAQGFYFDISPWAPIPSANATSKSGAGVSQFAVFTQNGVGPTIVGANSRINNTGDGRSYFVGAEDNACTQQQVDARQCANADGFGQLASDYDYNDMVLQVTAVPEPGSIALLGAGLAALGMIARRRRNA